MPEFYPHQTTGAEWLSQREHALLFDEQGLGKTITAIAGADKVGAHKMLIVAPSIVLYNWRREVKLWSPDRQVQLVDHGQADLDRRFDTVVTTHALLLKPWVLSQLLAIKWDLIVLDECQFFRTPTAQRVRAFYGAHGEPLLDPLVKHARRVWPMTGTPMPNNAGELWTHLWGLFPDRIHNEVRRPMSWATFRHHYCRMRRTAYGLKPYANKNLAELRQRLDGVALRRKKKDHLKDLPEIRFEQVTLPSKEMPHELTALSGEIRGKAMKAIDKVLDSDKDATTKMVFNALRDNEEFSRWRRLCGLAKVQPAAELLDMELEFGALEKVVVFAHHKDVIHNLWCRLGRYGVVRITGDTNAKQRQQAVDAFQDDPEIRVCLAQILAGGTGATLTAAHDVVFVELSFVPGENAQAADRCHRIGQTERVRVRFISLAGTVDEELTDALKQKTKMIREVLD